MVSAQQTPGPGTHKPYPELTPPGTPADPESSRAGGFRHLAWLALAGLGVLALLVIFLLPRLVSTPPPSVSGSGAVPPASPPEVRDPEASASAQRAAEQALEAYLHLRARLELANAPAWGEPEWSEAARMASAGDRSFAQRRFAPAAESYRAALQALKTLGAGRETRLAGALEAGEQALAANDSATASTRFETALAIAPDNTRAQAGLQRARVRPGLLEQLATGAQAEAADDLVRAQAAYQEAVRLDAAYAPAQTALARISRQLEERSFQEAMGRALAALEAGRFTDADTALAEADALQPGTAVVRDTRQRLAQARQRALLTTLKRQAGARVRAEDWPSAVDLYRKALAVDSRVGFARTGLAQAEDRMRLHRQLDHYLDDPDRLSSAEPLANAEQLLAAAGQAPAGEPRLAEKLATLQRLVSAARTPVSVTLTSDGLTDIVIYHVGRFGRFERKPLELPPGNYTAVGSRAGYRDVRRVFEVRPGGMPVAVDIRCEEPV